MMMIDTHTKTKNIYIITASNLLRLFSLQKKNYLKN